jgi:hypothetical protein
VHGIKAMICVIEMQKSSFYWKLIKMHAREIALLADAATAFAWISTKEYDVIPIQSGSQE